MIKKLPLALLCLSVSAYTHANLPKPATTELYDQHTLENTLIGTWQCTFNSKDYDNYPVDARYKSTLNFKADGTLISHKISHTTDPEVSDKTMMFIIDTERDWYVKPYLGTWRLAQVITKTNRFTHRNATDEHISAMKSHLYDNPFADISFMSFEQKDDKTIMTTVDGEATWITSVCTKD